MDYYIVVKPSESADTAAAAAVVCHCAWEAWTPVERVEDDVVVAGPDYYFSSNSLAGQPDNFCRLDCYWLDFS